MAASFSSLSLRKNMASRLEADPKVKPFGPSATSDLGSLTFDCGSAISKSVDLRGSRFKLRKEGSSADQMEER